MESFCFDDSRGNSDDLDKALNEFGVKLDGGDNNWNDKRKLAVVDAAWAVGTKFAEEGGNGKSASEAFLAEYGYVHFKWGCGDDCREKDKKGKPIGKEGGAFAAGWQSNNGNGYFLIKIGTMEDDGGMRGMIQMVHELGHIYDYVIERNTGSRRSGAMPDNVYTRNSLRPNGYWNNGIFTVDKTVLLWQMHPPGKNGDSQSEAFADIFVAWTFNVWNTSTDPLNVDAVSAAQAWMP